jgi:hypothetical protein
MSLIEKFQSLIKLNQNIVFNLKLIKLFSLIDSNKDDIIKAIIYSHVDSIYKNNESELLILFSQKVDLQIFMEFILNRENNVFIDRYRLYGYLHCNNYNEKLNDLNLIIQDKDLNIADYLMKFMKKFYTNYLYEIINDYFKFYLKLLKIDKYEDIDMDNFCQNIITNFDSSIDSIINILIESINSYSEVKNL